ncbi:MAG: hypothetical protein ACHRXM_37775 [Isosphaerales bacterium]
MDTLIQVLEEEPVSPRQLNAQVPRDLETICLTCLQKAPARRYASAAALGEDLLRYLANRPIQARPVGRAERLWRWCKRNPWLAATIGTVAAALLAVAVVSTVFTLELRNSSLRLKKSLTESNQRLAAVHFERGQAAFDKGETGPGLLFMVESWRSAVAGGYPDGAHSARSNLSAWLRQCPRIRGVFTPAKAGDFSPVAPVVRVAFMPGGKTILMARQDSTQQLWDLATGLPTEARSVDPHDLAATAYSPVGRHIHERWLHDPVVNDGSYAFPLHALAYSPDAKCFLDGINVDAINVDAATGRRISASHCALPFWTEDVAFSPDGKTVLAGGLLFFDTATGKRVWHPLMHRGTPGELRCAFSPDGKSLLIRDLKDLFLYDAAEGKLLWKISLPVPVIANAGSARLQLDRSPQAGRAVLPRAFPLFPGVDVTRRSGIRGIQGPLGAVLDSPPMIPGSRYGRASLPAPNDRPRPGLTPSSKDLLAAAARPPDTIFPGSRWSHGAGDRILDLVAFSRDSKTALTTLGNKVFLCDAKTGGSLQVIEYCSRVLAASFGPSGLIVLTEASAPRGLPPGSRLYSSPQLWNVDRVPIGAPLEVFDAVAFSRDGKTLLTCGRRAPFVNNQLLGVRTTIQRREAATGKPLGALEFPERNRDRLLAFAPSGRSFLIGHADGTAQLWDTATGKPLGPVWVPPSASRSVAQTKSPRSRSQPAIYTGALEVGVATFSPDGKTILTAGLGVPVFSPDGKTLLTPSSWLLDADTGQPRSELLHSGQNVEHLAYSPDGNTVLAGGGNSAMLSDAATGEPRCAPFVHPEPIECLAFSPDGNTIATGGRDGTVRLWEATTGRPIGTPLVNKGPVFAVAFSADSKTILTGGDNGTARCWDAATSQPIGAPLLHEGPVRSVAWNSDGHTVLTGSDDGMARIWDLTPMIRPEITLAHRDPVQTAAYSTDGQKVLTVAKGMGQLWDAHTGKPFGVPLVHKGPVLAMVFSPDDTTILTGSGGHLYRWDAASGRLLAAPAISQDSIRAIVISPDGKTVVTASDRTAWLRDTASWEPFGMPLLLKAPIRALAFGPDGKDVLTLSEDGIARIYDAATGQPPGIQLMDQGHVDAIAYSPDGRVVLTWSQDGTAARLWDVATGKPIGEPMVHRGPVVAGVYSPDGRVVLTWSQDGTARLWDVATGKPVGKAMVHRGPVIAGVYNPDGHTVLTASEDGTMRLWDAATGQPIEAILAHRGPIRAFTSSPDGKTAITGSEDGTARLWFVSTGKPLGPPIVHPGAITHLAFSPSGKTFLSICEEPYNEVRLSDASELPADLPRIATWVEVVTGMTLDSQGFVHALDNTQWLERRQRLRGLGGPP